jgi:glycosyltransferase involved in cell wall biosynthesis
MKITILVPSASREILPRVSTLYKLLEKNFDIEVIAIVKKKENTEHFKAEFSDFKKVVFDLGTIINDLIKTISGDIIYAMKAKPSSFGMAMSLKTKKKLPVVLDIDAREIYNCFPYSDNFPKNFFFSLLQFNNPNSFIYTWMLEKRIKTADNITVASSTLQKIFGGTLVYSGCDTEFFNSEIYKRAEIRKQMQWDKFKIIFLTLNIQAEEGLEDLIEALKIIGKSEIKLVIAGEKTPYLEKISRKEPFVSLIGYQPHLNIAKLLSAADLVVLPLRNIPANQGRVPLSLFEAMSAGKPVIATNISDFPVILEGCGLVFPEKDIKALKENIEKILDEPGLAEKLAKQAREKCIEKYSRQIFSKKLVEFLKKFEKV